MTNLTCTELRELRATFPITERVTYLDHAAVGPISRNVAAAIGEQTDLHCEDLVAASASYEQRYADTREAIARLVGSRPGRVAFVQNTSHGLSLIANGQPWRTGDNVIVPAMEFPSNYLPWRRLERAGVELRPLHAEDGRVTPDLLSRCIDARTRVVALSAVQYFNGFRVDLAGLAEVIHARDALLVVDGTQAAGAMTIDVDGSGVDALVVSAHKWMLGPLGIGFMALSDRMLECTEVTELGWLSVNEPFAFRREIDLPDHAGRFEPGTENAAGRFGLHARLIEIERFGMARIEARVLDLRNRLAEALVHLGFAISSPPDDRGQSGILTFHHEALASEQVVDSLKQARIHLSARHGNLRASAHYYNSGEEIEALVEHLRHCLASR